ncbi:sensor histidine kinase [Agromyces mariniharenae]|uniref:histidine kinase n=1 Tax=Agromyces mariniharenae TaxID=2604423 RepID=A0A5S4V8J4_9MICO|nr:histidine kinase [Agromyces mariniharenae]TYL54358.1 transcriptional regulator [Agromyces mariniharenae]
MAPGRRGRIARRTAIIVAVIVLSLFMEVSGFLATPEEFRPEVAYVTMHAIVPLVYAACAGVAWSLGPNPVPARMMVAFVALWIPTTFFQVVEGIGWLWPLLYGAHLLWAIVPILLPVVYPRGQLSAPIDRWLVGIILGISVVFFLGAVLLVGEPADPTFCACVPNPYQVADAPGIFALIDNGYRMIGAAVALVIAARLLVGWVRGSIPARAVAFLMPVALFAWTATLAALVVTYAAETNADKVLITVSLVALASIPVSFVAGVAHTRNMRARVADLMRITREGADRGLWAESLARTLRDASVRVYWWDEEKGRYADAAGTPIEDADADPRGSHSILPVASPLGAPIALIRHDRVLTDNARLLDGVSSALRLSVDNGRLRSEIERTLEQVRQSRQRIVEAGVEARRRIERDLHDGAQQHLVSLGMRLRLAANEARDTDEVQLATELEGTIQMLNMALRELRELAHGIHPSLLSSGGLSLAVPELAGRCPVPVEVDVQAEGRLPELIESTAYFVLSEALANVAKHSGASRAWVRAYVEDGDLELVVRDNGTGGASLDKGTGMLGVADRVDAVGGTLEVDSPSGAGTTLTVRIPLDGQLAEA